ncbi:MAG: nucleotide-binding protein [Pelolinea sp.]|nr:nucleotide-binding protein [Pelolinea sp.]
MSAKKSTTLSPVIPPSVTQEQAISLLQRQVDNGIKLLSSEHLLEKDFDAWESVTKDFLIKSFGSQSHHINDVIDIGKYGSYQMDANEQYWENRRRTSMYAKLKMLESLIEVLHTEIELRTPQPLSIQSQKEDESNKRSVFLVHGHDDSILHEVARFLGSLNLEVIILREQANEGRTIIEKFEDYSNVGFSIVLLTADDKGGGKDIPNEDLKPRARQNVILELGYFLGKLGRKRVCSLFQEGVDIPSDYSGVLFILIDKKGSWKLELAREIKASGINIDLNKAI